MVVVTERREEMVNFVPWTQGMVSKVPANKVSRGSLEVNTVAVCEDCVLVYYSGDEPGWQTDDLGSFERYLQPGEVVLMAIFGE